MKNVEFSVIGEPTPRTPKKICVQMEGDAINVTTESKHDSILHTSLHKINSERADIIKKGLEDRKDVKMNYEAMQKVQEAVDTMNQFYLLHNFFLEIHWSFCSGFDHAHQDNHNYFLLWGTEQLAFTGIGPTKSMFLFKGPISIIERISKDENELIEWAGYIKSNRDFSVVEGVA